MHTGGQKFLAQAGQRWRISSSEHERSNGKIELIDQVAFQQSAKERWPTFACDHANFVFVAQCSQHGGEIDMLCIAKMKRRFLPQGLLMFPRHSFGRKNNNGRNVRLKNLQPTVDLSFAGNDYANRVGRLPAFTSGFSQVCWRQAEPDVVALERAVADQDGVGQGALTKQMLFVFS